MERIVLVNTHVPQPWQQQVNDTIATVAQSYPNTTVVDWNTASANCSQCLYPDGVHLNPTGAKYYASLLVQALEAPQPAPAHQPARSVTSTTRAGTATTRAGTATTRAGTATTRPGTATTRPSSTTTAK
jgi:hypothetical protein